MTSRILVLSPTRALVLRRAWPGRAADSQMETLVVGPDLGQRVQETGRERGCWRLWRGM